MRFYVCMARIERFNARTGDHDVIDLDDYVPAESRDDAIAIACDRWAEHGCDPESVAAIEVKERD